MSDTGLQGYSKTYTKSLHYVCHASTGKGVSNESYCAWRMEWPHSDLETSIIALNAVWQVHTLRDLLSIH